MLKKSLAFLVLSFAVVLSVKVAASEEEGLELEEGNNNPGYIEITPFDHLPVYLPDPCVPGGGDYDD